MKFFGVTDGRGEVFRIVAYANETMSHTRGCNAACTIYVDAVPHTAKEKRLRWQTLWHPGNLRQSTAQI